MIAVATITASFGLAHLLAFLALAIGGISLRPSTFTEGGGLLDDVDVTVESAQFVLWDYNRTIQEPQPFLALELKDESGAVHPQYWTCGDVKYFVPSEDSMSLVPVGDKQGIVGSTNAAQFIASLVNAGFPEEKLDGPISNLNGLGLHVKQVAQPKRSGLIITGKGGKEKQNPSVLLVSKINNMPGEKAAAKPKLGMQGKGQAAAQTPATTAAAASTEAPISDDDLAGHVIDILAGNEGSIAKNKLPSAIMKVIPSGPIQKYAVARVFKPDFLQLEQGWVVDGANLKLPE